jgi:hypothetical protein
MPIFKIQTPSGKNLKIQADTPEAAYAGAQDWESKNSPQALAMADARKRQASVPQQVRAFSNGSTLGLANLLDAGGAAAETGLYNLTHPGKAHYGMADAFDAVRKASNEGDRQFAGEHPVQAGGIGILGALAMPGGAGLAKAVVGSGKLLPLAARGAAAGGLLGGVEGAATSDPGKELAGGVRGAQIGAMTGGVVPLAGTVATNVARGVGAPIARAANRGLQAMGGPTILNARQETGRMLSNAMRKDGLTSDKIRTITNEWMKSGVTPTLMDVANNNGAGQNTMSVIRGAAMSGPGRQAAVAHGNRVAADLQDNAIAATRKLTPDNQATAADHLDQLGTTRRDLATDQYAEPYKTPVAITPDILSAVADAPGQSAVRRAMAGATARRDYPQVQELQSLISGTPGSIIERGGQALAADAPPVSAGALDRIRIAMGEKGEVSSRAGARDIGGGLFSRASDVGDALDNVPQLAEARQTYRDLSSQMGGVEQGQAGLRPSTNPTDYVAAMADPHAQQGAQVGLRDSLVQGIGAPTEGSTGFLNRISSGTNAGQVLGATYGQDAAGGYQDTISKLVDQIGNARQINPNVGSQTAGRLADQGLVEGIPTTAHGWLAAAINKINRSATLTDEERGAILDLATSAPDPNAFNFKPPQNNGVSSALGLALAGQGGRQ